MATKENDVLRYVHEDHLTGTSLMTDSAGAQIGSTMKYLPFGETLTGSVPTDKLFTGQRLDDTGLYYYGARYYDSLIGRFISPDTVSANPANPQSLNRYTYALNNPLKYNDPTGHWPDWGAIWNGVCDFASGVGDAFVETGKAAWQMVTNPVDTIKSIGYAVTHPVDTFNAIVSSYSEKASSVHGWGQIIGEVAITIGTLAFSGGAAAGGKVAQTGSEVAQIGKITEKAIVIGEDMERVNTAAVKLGAETFKGGSMAANNAWIQAAKDAGRTIYDIGPSMSRRVWRIENDITPYYSPFYNMERQVLSNYPIIKLWTRTSKFSGIFPF